MIVIDWIAAILLFASCFAAGYITKTLTMMDFEKEDEANEA